MKGSCLAFTHHCLKSQPASPPSLTSNLHKQHKKQEFAPISADRFASSELTILLQVVIITYNALAVVTSVLREHCVYVTGIIYVILIQKHIHTVSWEGIRMWGERTRLCCSFKLRIKWQAPCQPLSKQAHSFNFSLSSQTLLLQTEDKWCYSKNRSKCKQPETVWFNCIYITPSITRFWWLWTARYVIYILNAPLFSHTLLITSVVVRVEEDFGVYPMNTGC